MFLFLCWPLSSKEKNKSPLRSLPFDFAQGCEFVERRLERAKRVGGDNAKVFPRKAKVSNMLNGKIKCL